MATIVETGKLLEAALASLGATVVVSLSFSLLVRGATRSGERRREGRTAAATAYVGLALVGLAGCLAAVAVGLLVMTAK
jgi:hypothetical protein